jgi:hypothetical protein
MVWTAGVLALLGSGFYEFADPEPTTPGHSSTMWERLSWLSSSSPVVKKLVDKWSAVDQRERRSLDS